MKNILLLAHGAGANKDSDWMQLIDKLISENSNSGNSVIVKRFNFPYMQKSAADGKRRPPDRMPKLLEYFSEQIKQLASELEPTDKIWIGGKSMGGRVASLLAMNEEIQPLISGIICLGFPFHPPGKKEKFRGEHLASIKVPTLILQGERDPFGKKGELSDWDFSNQVKIVPVKTGDHSFVPTKKSGLVLEDNMNFVASNVCLFVKAKTC